MSLLSKFFRGLRDSLGSEPDVAALRLVHKSLAPKNYFEIGCRHGRSLVLSKARSVAVDPDPHIEVALRDDVRVVQLTSDEFFRTNDPRQLLGGAIDLAFIDGMHLAEFALRDFINIEAAADPSSVVLFDDVFPADMRYASREMREGAWTGDVYRVIPLLRQHRPDLDIEVYETPMKGLAVVSNLDPASRVLRDNLAELEAALAAGAFAVMDQKALRVALAPRRARHLAGDLRRLATERLRNRRAA
jgi:hypothetical protein